MLTLFYFFCVFVCVIWLYTLTFLNDNFLCFCLENKHIYMGVFYCFSCFLQVLLLSTIYNFHLVLFLLLWNCLIFIWFRNCRNNWRQLDQVTYSGSRRAFVWEVQIQCFFFWNDVTILKPIPDIRKKIYKKNLTQ